MTARPWKRRLWGVEFSGTLIGSLWIEPAPPSAYAGEPTRALLFTTRAEARAWVAPENAKQAARGDWWGAKRYRVVRVVETVRQA